jgi:hypothetical protein
MMSLVSTVFVWSLSQNTLYNNAVRQTNEADLDRMAENIKVLNTTYSANTINSARVVAELQNLGPSSVEFMTIWIYMSNDTWHNYNFAKLVGFTIQGGANRTLAINLAVPGVYPMPAQANYSCSSWLITARGSTVTLETETFGVTNNNFVTNSGVSQGIGYLAMNFEEFRYFKYKTVNTLANFPTGNPGYNPPNEAIVFRLNLTNFDPSGLKRTLTINKYSLLWLYFPTKGVVANWYVVNVDATGKILPSYADISVPYGADNSVIVYFASGACGSFGGNPDQVKPGASGVPAAINLLLLGLIGSDQYGQNIPFVSVLIQ